MHDVQYYKSIFDKYGGMMRTTQLAEEKIFYPQREKLIADGHVEKIRRGYYQWINPDDFSEVRTVIHLFPDAILCMDTALRYYGYSDRTPSNWHLAVSKDSGKSRFKIVCHINSFYSISQGIAHNCAPVSVNPDVTLFKSVTSPVKSLSHCQTYPGFPRSSPRFR